MPKLLCPRCNVSIRAKEELLQGKMFCPSCGNCLWQPTQPAAAVPLPDFTPPPVQRPAQSEPSPRPSPPRVVYLEAAPGTPPALVIACLVVGAVVFAGLVAMMLNGSKRPSESSKVSRPTLPSIVPADFPSVVRPPEAPPSTTVKSVSASREGQTWSLSDLYGYLLDHHIECKAAERAQASVPGMWLTTSRGDRLLVQHFDAGPSAKIAGAAQAAPNERVFQWGRFLIVAREGPFFRAVREVLN